MPYGLILPASVLVTALMVIPIVVVAGYSLMDNVIVERSPTFVGLANYLELLSNADFWVATRNTVIYTVFTVGAHFLLGLGYALMLNHRLLGPVATAIFRTFAILPWIFTASVVAVLWRLLLDPNGFINWALISIGAIQEAVPWLATEETALAAVILISVWAGYPIYMISLLAGLQAIAPELQEAALVDGASAFRRFWHITLPGLRPVIISMTLLDTLWTTQQFTLIWATTGGGPIDATEVLSTFTYRLAFSSYQFAMASTSAMLILLASVVVAVLYVRQQKKASEL